MKLVTLTERVWYHPYEQERDRPNLGYIRGDRWSVAVDAGHSKAHVEEFYRALEEEGLPLPSLTVLTHWHWDHTFGMHAVHGLCLAGRKTNGYLAQARERLAREGEEAFLSKEESVRREYANGDRMVVREADMSFSGELLLDAGSCPVRAFETEAPHTDDSVLVCVPGEGVLFAGDSICGSYPTWEKDPALCRALADSIAGAGAGICLTGHWTPLSLEETVSDLLEG